jgi:hypothetical protein
VAYWILPRFPGGVRRREAAAWLSLALLNAGVWIAGAAPAITMSESSGLVLTGRVLEVLAAGAFAVHAWPRVRAFGG